MGHPQLWARPHSGQEQVCPQSHGLHAPTGRPIPHFQFTVPLRGGVSPGSGQAPSATCRSSSAMYPWSPPAPTASNTTWAGRHAEVGSLHAPLITSSGPQHPALSHLPVAIRLYGDVAAVPAAPFHGAYAQNLPPYPALLHEHPEGACPGHPTWRRGPGLCHMEPPPIWRCPQGVSGQVVLTWGPSTQLVPEGQALSRHGELVRLGGEGSCVPCRQGDSARVHHHVMAWRRKPLCCDPCPALLGSTRAQLGLCFCPRSRSLPSLGTSRD